MKQTTSSSYQIAGGGMELIWSTDWRKLRTRLGSQQIVAHDQPMFFLNGEAAQPVRAEQRGGELAIEAAAPGGRLRVTWAGNADRLRATVAAESEAAEVREAGFALPVPPSFLVSGNGSTVAWDSLPTGRRVSFDSAAFTMTQLFLLECGGAWLRIGRQERQRRDYTTGYLEKRADGWWMIWLWQPQKPFGKRFVSQPLELAVFPSRTAAIEEHRQWMERTFQLVPKEQNPRAPAWLHDCKLLCQINLGEANGAILHDYTDVRNLIYALHASGVPKNTIVYVLDYNPLSWVLRNYESGVYAWPENPFLGGTAAFRRMMQAARECGYRVLAHSTVVLYGDRTGRAAPGPDGKPLSAWHNPQWPEMEPFAVRDTHGNPVGFPSNEVPLTMDSGCIYGLKYLDARFPRVQEHYLQSITRLRAEYGLDAFHLDSLSNVDQRDTCFNTPVEAGERAAAERQLMARLHDRNPGTLFWAERLTEETADLCPMAMYHYPAEFARLYSELFGRYQYLAAHTGMPGWIPQRYPKDCMISAFAEDALEQELAAIRTMPNVIPRVKLNYRDYRLDERSLTYIRAVLDAAAARRS